MWNPFPCGTVPGISSPLTPLVLNSYHTATLLSLSTWNVPASHPLPEIPTLLGFLFAVRPLFWCHVSKEVFCSSNLKQKALRSLRSPYHAQFPWHVTTIWTPAKIPVIVFIRIHMRKPRLLSHLLSSLPRCYNHGAAQLSRVHACSLLQHLPWWEGSSFNFYCSFLDFLLVCSASSSIVISQTVMVELWGLSSCIAFQQTLLILYPWLKSSLQSCIFKGPGKATLFFQEW